MLNKLLVLLGFAKLEYHEHAISRHFLLHTDFLMQASHKDMGTKSSGQVPSDLRSLYRQRRLQCLQRPFDARRSPVSYLESTHQQEQEAGNLSSVLHGVAVSSTTHHSLAYPLHLLKKKHILTELFFFSC